MSAKKATSRIPARKRSKAATDETADLLKLVKAGVRQFIIYGAPIGDFQKAIREVSKKGKITSHPLTGVEFRRIVKEAVQQRKKKLVRRRRRSQ